MPGAIGSDSSQYSQAASGEQYSASSSKTSVDDVGRILSNPTSGVGSQLSLVANLSRTHQVTNGGLQNKTDFNVKGKKPSDVSSPPVPAPGEIKQMDKLSRARYVRAYKAGDFNRCQDILNATTGMMAMVTSSPGELNDIEKSAKLGELSYGSSHFHGSRSASLIIFDKSTPAHLRGKLLPTGMLLQEGLAPFSGELGCALEKNSINSSHLSVVDSSNVSTAYDYACTLHPKTWSPTIAADDMKNASTQLAAAQVESHAADRFGEHHRYGLNNRISLNRNQLMQWNKFDPVGAPRDLIKLNFPVLFGFKLDASESLASGGMPGEVGVRDGVSSEKMRVVFVPTEHIELVQNYFHTNDVTLPVKAISQVEPLK